MGRFTTTSKLELPHHGLVIVHGKLRVDIEGQREEKNCVSSY
jgi:hypothetical protein